MGITNRYKITEVDDPPYRIDERLLQRFDQRQTVFGRMLFDREASFYEKGMYDKAAEIIKKGEPGYSHLDFVRALGAWTVYDYFHGAFSPHKLEEANNVMPKPAFKKFPVTDPEAMSEEVKKTALLYGASGVGICRVDRRWIYSFNMDGIPLEIPDDFKYAVVLVLAMDYRAIETSPAYPACIESGLCYSRMAFCVACLAEFIRYLGYKALPMGNDTALSIPLAIDAGLGELGRLGLLITPEYGPCVRLCKVFTDMPLSCDKPIRFGVTEFCKRCTRCADACEVEAIQKTEEPTYDTVCPSNNQGILRWPVDHDKCYQFWIENGGDCSRCIAACPFDPRKKK